MKQRETDLRMSVQNAIRNVKCLGLERGWSKLIKILHVSSAQGLKMVYLALSDKDNKICWKNHYKKLLKTEFV